MRFYLLQIVKLPAPLRLGIFLGGLALVWLPFALPIYFWIDDPNTESLLSLPILYCEFIVLLRFWGRWVYQVPNLLTQYGLEFSRRSGQEWALGVGLGVVSLLALFAGEGALGWIRWQSPSGSFVGLCLIGFIVAAGFGFAEELLFRGWLLEELRRDYRPDAAQWLSAVVFALVHGVRPQFPALVLFGAALVWAKSVYGVEKHYAVSSLQQRCGRLSLPMGLHTGLIWAYYVLNVGQMMGHTGRVPTWVTGLDGNPLAGLLGIGFMGGWVWALRSQATHRP